MLSTIARHNPDSMLEVCERLCSLADETFWELKTQCLEFSCGMLTQFRSYSHLLAAKDDLKSGAAKSTSPAQPNANVDQARGSSSNADKTVIKNALSLCIEIIRKCFNVNAPKSVQKLGLFKI